MEDVNTSQQAPPEEDVANNLQEGSSDSSEDEEAASFADDSPDSYIEPGVVKAMRRLAKHRASLIPLAVLASALVLALVVRRRMHPVEEELVEAAAKPKVEPLGLPGLGGVLEETPEKPVPTPPEKLPGVSQEELVEGGEKPKVEPIGLPGPTPPEKLPGVSEEELVEGGEKPKVEPIGLPGVSGVLEETSKQPVPTPPEKLPGVSQEELVEGGEKPKVEPIGLPGVSGVPEETPKKSCSPPQPVQAPVPVQIKPQYYEYKGFEAQNVLRDVVRWAKEAPVRKDESVGEEQLWESRLKVVWRFDGVRYDLLAHFTNLTPAYDAERVSVLGLIVTMNFESAVFEQTAAELKKGVLELFEQTRLYEEQARNGEYPPACRLEFGDPQSGEGSVSITMSRSVVSIY
ncbi:hypothetical protein Emed_003061 [Eimeria media]